MNPEEFIKMMNDLPDEIIDSANDSRFKHHRKIWYIAPTIAACFVAFFMAAIYPKIRIQTPDIRSDTVISNDTTPSITNSTVSSSDQISTTSNKSEISESSATNLSSESSGKAETAVTEVSAMTTSISVVSPPTDTSAIIEPEHTRSSSYSETIPVTVTTRITEQTETSASVPVIETSIHSETSFSSASETPSTTTTLQPSKVVIPLWKGVVGHPETISDPSEFPYISCHFEIFKPTVENHDLENSVREYYGIPLEYDATDQHFLLIHLVSEYAGTIVLGGEISECRLVLKISHLNHKMDITDYRFAIAIPTYLELEPENCCAEYQIFEGEGLIPQVDNPTIELIE